MKGHVEETRGGAGWIHVESRGSILVGVGGVGDAGGPRSHAGGAGGRTGSGGGGGEVAGTGDAWGMKVIGNCVVESTAPAYEGFRWAGIEDLLGHSDVVSLHCPLFPETQGLMNAARLAHMKRTAFL